MSKRRMFSPDEDEILKNFVKENGNRNWNKISEILKGRTPRQCRDRYRNYLREGLNSHPWTEDEDMLIKKLYNELGPKWVAISKMLNDRNGIDVKNRWNELCSHLKIGSKSQNSESINNSLNDKKQTFVLKKKIFSNPEDIQNEINKHFQCNKNENDINEDTVSIAISEEEFYNILSYMDYFLPLEEYATIRSSKVTNLF